MRRPGTRSSVATVRSGRDRRPRATTRSATAGGRGDIVVKSVLGEAETTIAGGALQATLADLVDLSLVAKQAHWNVVGRQFRSVHLQLDEVVDTARQLSDVVAERAATIGVSPDGRAASVAAASGVPAHPDGWVQDAAVVDWFVEALAAVVARLRERIEETDKADLVTQGLLIEVAAALEKHLWMFQAQRS